jgi:hypothetical protein
MVTDPMTHLSLHTATTARTMRDMARRTAAVPRSTASGRHQHARTLAAWAVQARRLARSASGRLSRA